jgi:nucleoside 2-deoxyribosyltransferase
MRVYLAAPFFNPQQIKIVEDVEEVLNQCQGILQYYSPRQSGIVLKDLPPAVRMARAKEVYDANIANMEWCDVIVAVVDGRDAGTFFEIGWGIAKGKIIITYTAKNYGLNVMLQESVAAHVTNMFDLLTVLKGGATHEACARYRNFNPEGVT